eukprot:COSAG02_NODE_13070_length_1450_cov_1.155440_2_plen_76_part_00
MAVANFPAKGWDKNAPVVADRAALAVRARLQEIYAPLGLAFKVTVCLNVFAKTYLAKRLPDGSTPRLVERLLAQK